MKTVNVAECKIQASILLKSLRSADPEKIKKAVKRFQRLPEFATFSANQILQHKIQRKHALAVIAVEKGFHSWVALKTQVPFIIGGFLNQWFANYAAAKAYQKLDGGYLLPYKKQFFVCDANYIEHLKLEPDDTDWKAIDYDWVQPANHKAWQRLYAKWMKIQGNEKD